ncbi:MAG TPA: sigma 54-interacting transcriptional regulator [Syntrophales bacterium]|nr:sigma 54-interacting transcriptional regulator [Syntrophales bacterium]
MQGAELKIGVIVSTLSLLEQMKKIAQEQGLNLHCAFKGLEEAIDAGKKMEAEGVDVIISRLGTVKMLRDNLHIPVLSIPQASIDIFKSFVVASKKGKKIILATFMNEIGGIDVVEELLGIKIHQAIYTDIASMESAMLAAKNQGYDVAVGGGLTMRICQKHGLKYVEFETNEEIVAAVFEDAKSVAWTNREEQKKGYRYQCIIDAATEGIIALDDQGRINAINQAAKDILKIDSPEIVGSPISNYLGEALLQTVLNAKEPTQNLIEKIHGDLFVFNLAPMQMYNERMGKVLTIKTISNVIKVENEVRRNLARGLVAKYHIKDLVHKSVAIQEIVRRARKFSQIDSTVLITGATGTGKEVLAQSIHNLSRRAKAPFVSVNCGAFPEQLLESELFGYEEGAFTGSRKGGKPGLIELAHKGTFFLDEIDSTPTNVQTRLLRVIQEREVMRVGADQKIPVDIRIIAAANRDLGISVQEGRFREDLFFRLNVLRLDMPPLAERRDDIPVLLDHYTNVFSNKYRISPIVLPASYIQKLTMYSWPGNVRQLQNFVERLILCSSLSPHSDILDEIYEELIQYPAAVNSVQAFPEAASLRQQMRTARQDQESLIIQKILERTKFCKTKAARELGISRTTLWRKLKDMA